MPSKQLDRASAAIERLLDLLEIPQRQRIARLEEAASLSDSAVRRRMTGAADWSVEELRSVAEHFGLTLADLFSAEDRQPIKARLRIDSWEAECLAWLTLDSGAAAEPDLVAVNDEAEGWVLRRRSDQVRGALSSVEKLVIRPRRTSKLSLAILDDDADTANTLAAFANLKSFAAQTFTSIDALSVRYSEFDAFIIDWLIHDETALSLVQEIRRHNPKCPIIILTGQMNTGRVTEETLVSAGQMLHLEVREKPARPSMLLYSIEMQLGRPAENA